MSVLSDHTIHRLCQTDNPLIDPYTPEQLQPASYDLLLESVKLLTVLPEVTIRPGEFLLASTQEIVNLPSHIVGRIEGKSSLARMGLIIHTAGFVDPGFTGQLTLEITNLSNKEVPLKRGMRIAQIAFQFLDRQATRPYGTKGLGSHYQGQRGPTPSSLVER